MINKLKELKNFKSTFIIIAIWIIFYILCSIFGIDSTFYNKGWNSIGNEYYRIFTGMFLHINILHLLANVLALYWIGVFLEEKIGSIKYFLFSIISGTISNLLFTVIYANHQRSLGGSVITFSLIGLIIANQIFDKETERFRLGTWYGNWILAYAILGNLPFFGGGITRLVIHIIALLVGIILSCAIYQFSRLKRIEK